MSGDLQVRPFRWRRFLASAVVVNVAVVLASLLVPAITGGRVGGAYLSVDEELSLPAAWSVILFASTALMAALLGWTTRSRSRRTSLAWTGFATLTALMALDEGTGIHERLIRVVDWLVPGHGVYFGWVLIGIPVALAVVGVVLYLARSLPRRARFLLVLGFVVFFAGAIGVESLTSTLLGQELFTRADVPYRLLVHLEELLEFMGAALMLASPLSAVAWARSGEMLLLAPLPAETH